MPPTAISHQIKLLESYCGRPLFRRRPRPLALTEAGARLFPVIREGLDSFADALSAVHELPLERSLSVSTTDAFASRWLVPRLPLWREVHPGISLEIMRPKHGCCRIRADSIDRTRWSGSSLCIPRYKLPPPLS
jgi:LysR family glycine cleavage system transcriptional activator